MATLTVAVEAQGLYRIADPSIEGYELYRGLGGADPDFNQPPFETFAALPHTTAALAASQTHRFVLRYRNRFNLLSQNNAATEIVIDGDGEQTPTPPSGPFYLVAAAAAAGTVTITARYLDFPDGDNAADAWLIYLTTDGADPDPAVDVPIEQDMNLPASGEGQGDGVVELIYTTEAQLEGTVVKAIVRTRRSGTPDADSTNTTIVSAVATLLGPAAVNPADGFYGAADRQA